MSAPMSHDPLHRLPQETIPEPSAGRMQETLAAAQQLFDRQPVEVGARQRKGRPFFGRTWMEAILGAGLVSTASVLAIVMSPAVLQPSITPEPVPPGPIRTDMVSREAVRPLSLDMQVDLEPYSFGELKLGARNLDDRYALYHVDDRGLELQLVEGRKGVADTITITDATMAKWGERDVIAVRSGFGALQRWEAFADAGIGYDFSAALSHVIWDAASADDVAQRLLSLPVE